MGKKARWDGGDVVIDSTGMKFKVGWYQQHPAKSAAARAALGKFRRGDSVQIELVDAKSPKGDSVRPGTSRARIL
ncbi:MAG: hypothetical protein Q7R76_01290 [Candidatus Woesearchaeota archaeon]|nr:hypothetical protein [Candidatus Woesearchaeota archaeon]